MYAVEFFTVDKDKIKVDNGEIKRRLSVSKDFDVSVFDGMLSRVLSEINPKCCYIKVPVSVCGNEVDLGFTKVQSRNLAKNIGQSKEAFVFAVTLGHSADRMLSKLSRLSPAELFICDGICSAVAEGACDQAEKVIKGSLKCSKRFSPGYGDFDISVQKDVLTALNAQKLLGITLTNSNLMVPQKSVTAVMAVSEAKNEE